jgi:hypothetical protein
MMVINSAADLRHAGRYSFNAIGLEYEYEIEGFEMGEIKYLPDFYIPSLNRWFEIKGKAFE